jgi:hypothetical protein
MIVFVPGNGFGADGKRKLKQQNGQQTKDAEKNHCPRSLSQNTHL